jgi:hypothetical protein
MKLDTTAKNPYQHALGTAIGNTNDNIGIAHAASSQSKLCQPHERDHNIFLSGYGQQTAVSKNKF